LSTYEIGEPWSANPPGQSGSCGGRSDLIGSARSLNERMREGAKVPGAFHRVAALPGRERRPSSAFDRDILPHLASAYRLARWLVKDPATAEDVVQDAFVRALGAFERFRGENPRAWLLQIVRNVALDAIERRRRHATREVSGTLDNQAADDDDPLHQIPHSSDDPETALARRQDGRALDALLAALPADLRECIVLRELEDLSYKEISEITGSPIGTVMSRLWRARRSLAAAARGSAP
jgi:RNA polymerase sigma factor (sigma-70 family)